MAVTPKPERPVVADPHRAGLGLHQALGGEHVLDLARPDPERQRAERAVGGGVRVAAHDRHPRLGDAELGADHVHDPLVIGAERVQRDAELLAVALERLDLHARELVADPRRDRRAVGRARCGRPWPACGRGGAPCARRAGARRRPAGSSPRGPGAGRCRCRPARDLVRVPDLVEQRSLASAPPQSGAEDREQHGFLGAWIFKMMIQVCVERDAVAIEQLVPLAVAVQERPCRARRARSRGCRARASAGSPGPPVTAPGASVWRESSARWPGSGGVRIS